MFQLFNNPVEFFGVLIAFLAAITVHEFAHAWTSDRLGDPTAKLMGRLSLNPIAHLDLFGTLMILFAPFGWAKPVQVDPFNFRHPKKDMALTSLAGPTANLLFALALAIFYQFSTQFLLFNNAIGTLLSLVLRLAIIMNVNLAIFNLIPIHPLDGFAIVRGILPDRYARQWQELEPYGIIFLIFLVFPILGRVSPISQFISPIINTILSILLPTPGII
jgi:Zn-dependent protease